MEPTGEEKTTGHSLGKKTFNNNLLVPVGVSVSLAVDPSIPLIDKCGLYMFDLSMHDCHTLT